VKPLEGWKTAGVLKQTDRSIVELVTDLDGKRKRVMKYIRSRSKNVAEQTVSFVREISALIDLHHPLVIAIEGYSLPDAKTNGKILMEHMENGSLEEHMFPESGSERILLTNETRTATIVAGIVLAMRYIHSRGFIHRDLKPANILLDANWRIRIADFGTSIIADTDHTNTPQTGTPLYTAPECYEESGYDWRADIYAFALILYEILTGEHAFSRRLTMYQLMAKVTRGVRPAMPGTIRPTVRDLITKCWAAEPDQRPSFAEIFDILKAMDFMISPNVDTPTVRLFVNGVIEKENEMDAQRHAE
jgi:serine/threonine protein kinase